MLYSLLVDFQESGSEVPHGNQRGFWRSWTCALIVSVVTGCGGVETTKDVERSFERTIRQADEKEVRKAIPIISIESRPDTRSPALVIQLRQRRYVPIYEYEVYEEIEKYETVHDPNWAGAILGTLVLEPLTDPGIWLRRVFGGKSSGQSKPRTALENRRYTGEDKVTNVPWSGGKLTAVFGSLGTLDYQADGQGYIEINLVDLLRSLDDAPVEGLEVTLLAKIGNERARKALSIPRGVILAAARIGNIDLELKRRKAVVRGMKQASAERLAVEINQATIVFANAFEVYREGNIEFAITEFRRGLAIDPANHIARFYLAELLQIFKQEDAAREEYYLVFLLAPISEKGQLARERLRNLGEL